MIRTRFLLLTLLISIFSAACSKATIFAPTSSPTPSEATSTVEVSPAPTDVQPVETPTSPPPQTPDQFAPIIADLAATYGIPANEITVVSYEAVDWPDSCLGVQRPGIACLEVITPGYRLIFRTPKGQVEVHTNLDLSIYRVLASASGIHGQALVGPACPGPVRPGQQCPDQPYQGIIQITDESGNAVAEVTTAEDGTFQVELPPGNYLLVLPPGAKFPSAAPQPVTVVTGEYSQVQFLLDSGMR